jgi:hypothetical protein
MAKLKQPSIWFGTVNFVLQMTYALLLSTRTIVIESLRYFTSVIQVKETNKGIKNLKYSPSQVSYGLRCSRYLRRHATLLPTCGRLAKEHK